MNLEKPSAVNPIDDFLFALQQKNITLWIDNDKLRFKAPAGALSDALRAEMGQRKEEILDFLRRKTWLAQPIPRRPDGLEVPASFAQQRLLFLEQMEEQQAVYNIPAVFHCEGRLDPQRLEAALIALVERHESLRTRFPTVDGQVMAEVGEVYNPLHITDLRALDATTQRARAETLLAEHARQRFDLARGPLLSLHLIELGNDEQILAFNTHHIVSDGWSVGVMIREWKALYDAQNLPPLPIQFNDYAAWQRQWLAQGVLTRQRDYWVHQLHDLPELLELPTDGPRPALMSVQGQHLHVSLDAALGQQVQQFSQAQGTTVFMTLLAVFNLLLHRWSGQADLAVGTPIANRPHSQTEGLIGLFVNTLVLRSRFEGTQRFTDMLAATRQTALSAYAHQDLPFDDLVEALNPTRSMGHSPLFQVMFALQNAHQERLELGGVRLTLQPPAHPIAKSDLSLSVVEQDGRLDCDWEFRTDLFSPATVARLAERFEQVLRSVLADPTQSVTQVPLLTPADVQQLTTWGHQPLDLPTDRTVVDLFEAQAARHPSHTAVVFNDQSLTYGELNARANQWAHHLATLGAGPDTLVGLCVDRSIEMIVGLLAILKSGSAYLPLDPEYPQDRLEFMLADAGLTLVLTHSTLRDRLPATSATICCVDQVPQGEVTSAPMQRSGPAHLAYIIYTSGSTGRPKGVMIEHAALANYVQAMAVSYGTTPADRVLQFSSINFDASVEEMFVPLTTGAAVVIRDREMLATESHFLAVCEQQAITVLPMPTAYWHQLVSAQVSWPQRIRLVVIGGEAVSPQHVHAWQTQRLSSAQLINAYGPTEATISATTRHLIQGQPADACIGQPMPNTRVYLLGENLQPVPPGTPGELCIAGAGLARGYLNRPELTAEKFVEIDVFGHRERVYRSGDLARWRPDGQLDYLGRLDTQVKLRGFRIELGEIEGALLRHPEVREAVVVLHDAKGDPSLAAYITPRATAPADLPAALRTLLREHLPQWMVPASFTVLDTLPLNPNGKVDRKALPAPDRASAPAATPLLRPQTGLETQIAEIWQAVLKRDHVSIDDNFFDLGGHSLLLLQVLGRLRERLGRPLPVVTLFQYPTIQSLAAHLSREAEGTAAPATPVASTASATVHDEAEDSDDVAIIGMAGRFPGAEDLDTFWRNLREGIESIRSFSDEELLASGVDPALFNRPDYVRASGTIEQPEYFDAAFFGYPPREAELLDPQQRLFMETAWTALEHAGYAVGELTVPVGIFAGAGSPTYFFNNLWPNQALRAQFGTQQLLMGGDKDFVAARAAYKLDLRGPALSLSTACSTSLVAVHMARQSLLQGECRMALAGGVTVFFPQQQGYLYQEGGILSPDGHCRAFDADAQGSVGGAGVATVVLKRLRHALEDGDTIHAVIKGSAINNDGNGRVGFTAPSVEGQARVVREAMRGLDFDSVSYIETHGTATRLGDPIEIAALTQAYQTGTGRRGFCALGSVKTNIGHLDTAAGVTGLIKTVLALQHREMPPTLHFRQPNPQLDLEGSPFFVNATLRPWEASAPRRAGVSSFGIGGTNAHVVLEEAPAMGSDPAAPWQLLCLSAKTDTALQQYRDDLAHFLTQHPDINLADVAHTLQVGRARFAHRGFIVGRDVAELTTQLAQPKSRHWQRAHVEKSGAQVAFMFPGQGSQYLGMGWGLYEQHAVFREAVDTCAELLQPHLALDIRSLIDPATADAAAATTLKGSQAAQPALFTIEYALARLCQSWGIEPVAMIGHSLGEYVAACLAGVFSLADVLQLVAVRGRLMQSVPAGEMLGILLPREEVAALLPDDVHIAAHNAPRLTSVSGSPEAVARLVTQLQEKRVLFSRLQTLNAAHSPVMAPVLEPLRAHLRTLTLHPPQRPFISNLTGTWITPEQATSPDYWCEHLRQPVRFTEGLQTLAAQGVAVLLEVGPEMVLTSFAQQHRPQIKLTALNLLRSAASTQDDRAWVLGTLGQLWLKGVAFDGAALHRGERRRRLPLPTYPFERQRYWIEPQPVSRPEAPTLAAATPLGSACAVSVGTTNRRPDQTTDHIAPATATQQQLAAIWEQLLGIAPIGLHDDFFRLGGNSLLGVQVLSRLREAFSVEIPLNTLFVHPVLEDLATWLDGQRQTHADQAPAATLPPILPQPADAPLVMSFPQQRLRFLAQMEGDGSGESATYNLPGVVHLRGRLDETALRQAFVALVQRHDSLRLSFPLVDGEAIVHKGEVYDPVMIDDLREHPAAERDAVQRAWLTRHAQAPFDLSTGPLLRLHVLKLAEQEHLLLVNMHHIISDGWTIGLLIHEWCQLYNAGVRGEPADLPALPIQYTDYAAWQRQWLQGEVLNRQMAYWGHKLAGAPELLELPTDFPRPAVTSYRGAHQRLMIPAELAQRLQAFGQAHGVTLFMTLMAAFKVLLYRYSGQTDVLVGTPVANRTQRDTEHLVGFFVNTLVLRDVLDAQADFLTLLQQVKHTELEAHDHQDVPFDHLVEHLNPTRSLSHAPLFQVMFALQNAPAHGLVLEGLESTLLESDVQTAKFDLTLSVEARDQALACDWEFSTDLFRPDTIARMHTHWQVLLEGIVADARRSIARLPMLTDTDRAQLLAWNQTDRAVPQTLTVVDLFEQQVDRTPEAPAAVFEGQVLSYAELDARANQVAHALIERGVGPDTLVGLCVPRSLEMVIGLFGVLKAGGAYVPLDPDYPEDRLAFMVKDAQAAVLLTHSAVRDRLPISGAAVLQLDEPGTWCGYPPSRLTRRAAATDLAYVIYTSGSTGRPKGVALEHRNTVAFLQAYDAATPTSGVGPTVTVCPFSFDVSVWEFFSTLCQGHCLHLLPPTLVQDATALAGYLTTHTIHQAYLPPALLQPVLDVLEARGTTSLQRLLVGVEPIAEGVLQRFRALSPQLSILNGYGPTEATTCATFFDFRQQQAQRNTPIGAPLANTRIYLLDAHLNPVPPGVPGELCIAGAGLARGYLNRPELTAEKFIQVQVLGRSERLYRTGDLARWDDDGQLHYLGRIDQQVKLRGFRIELGEIESALTEHDAVSAAVVVVREREGLKALAGYVVLRTATEPDTLRTWLKARLPEYMVPATLTVLDALPLTPNGKVDRKALPEPVAPETGREVRTEAEQWLAQVYANLLKTDVRHTTAHFFELGGHSLLATQLASRIREGFGVDMPLRVLFEHPVLGDLAAWLAQQQRGGTVPPILPQPAEAPLPLSTSQERLWFLAGLEGPSATYNIPAAVRLRGTLHEAALRRTFQCLVERHASLRMAFLDVDGTAHVSLRPTYDPLTVTDLRTLDAAAQDATVQQRLRQHGVQPFDLATDPLLRLELLVLADDTQVLLFNMHHIISDGWSMALLLREASQMYAAQIAGTALDWAPLSIQYTDYAAWQREQLGGGALVQPMAWWLDHLTGAPTLLELPTDHPRPARQSFRGASLKTQISPALTQRLHALTRQRSSTLFMTLLAAFGVLLQRHSGQDDLVIGSPIANRTQRQTEGLIGFFVNTLALRLRCTADLTFNRLLDQVRRTALDAYARQDVPFDHLVEHLRPERSLSHSALFQVMFVLQNNEDESIDLPGLHVEPLALEVPTAKFDLTLSAEERHGALVLDWEYAADLFEARTVRRWAERFEVLLASIVEAPETDIRALPLLPATETAQIAAWNDTAAPVSSELLHTLFLRQAVATPERVAVIAADRTLRYAELHQEAWALAGPLRALGVGPNQRVAVVMGKGWEQVVAVLGILLAGGAYLPIDPDLPAQRRNYLLEQADVRVALCQPGLTDDPTWPAAVPIREVHPLSAPALAQVPAPLPILQQPQDLAYIIYTSGSTGLPKGVAIDHRGAVNTVLDMNRRFGIGAEDRVLSLSALNFDLSVYDIFGLLATGGCVVMPAPQDRREPARWAELLVQHGVTLWNTVPALMHMLVEHQAGQALAAPLRQVWMSGDWIPLDLPERIRQLWPQAAQISLGGATEASIWSIFYPIGTVDPAWKSIPYGRALANQSFWVLNEQLEPCPVGTPGQLYIGGIGLAVGYWGDADKTAAAFIVHPRTGERLYRTGDLGRWQPDGQIEFLGRADTQVKIRGHRIELGEIEACLRRHDAVGETVVMVRQQEGRHFLAAYLTAAEPATVEPAQLGHLLREALQQQLPDYMVPTTFTVLDALPLTANGKIDRQALPDPALASSERGQAPRTEVERLLCALWSQTLHTEVNDVQSHFFDIGGHSLLATQLVSRIREGFGVAMSLQTVFERPLLVQQAEWLMAQQPSQPGQALAAAIRPLEATEVPSLSYAQQRLWFLAHLEGQNAAYNIPLGLRLRGALDETALRQASCALVERHESLRLCFPEVDGRGTVQRLPAYDPLCGEDLSALPEAERQRQLTTRLAHHGQAAFNLDTGPLFALHLLKLDAHDHVLLFNMHHIISDGWSMGVIVRDWNALYEAARQHRAPTLPALAIQYTDYAAWQKRWLSGPALQEQLSYWRDTLADAPELLELPTDFSRPAVKTYQGRHLGSVLPADLSADLHRLCRAQGVTPYMALLAAFKVLLYRYSGQTDLLVGSPIANRTQGQTEDLVGFFVNTLVMRSQLGADIPFTELLKQVRQTSLAAYSHQDIPFEYLVEKLNPARSTSHSPLFQVMFILQNTPMGTLAFGDTTVSLLDTELTTAKFDLTLSMVEQAGQFHCDWEYSTDLFEAESIRRLAGHFEALLRQLVQAPQQPYARFSLLTPAEAQELRTWNDTPFDHPRQHTLLDLLDAQVAQRPEDVAARFGASTLTYAELDRRANRLAHHLVAHGVGPDGLVGLCVERSLDMLVGLLGILKAGGAYVPMDPEYPRERLQMMREDAAMPVLLTQTSLCPLLSAGDDAAVICLDRDADVIAQQPAEAPPRRSGPGHLAYVIFTSGSTGRPKGVMIGHGALLNFLCYMQQRLGIQAHDRLLALTTLSFDIAGLELWLPLISGSQVVIVSRETAMDGERLMQEMAARAITFMQATPATWKLLLQSGWQPTTPLTLLCGGEAMPSELGKHLLARSQQLWNVYGPTETTIWSAMHDVTRHPGRPQLIGQPIGNTQVYIVDGQGCVVPPGMPGELCIGGEGLAQGYLGRPDLTAERFIEIDLFGQRTRVYRTGDLARWLRNGTLECLGRIDHQVKVRGFRIELGEIEEVLTRHPRVREAAVITDAAREQLLAYVVPQDEVADSDRPDRHEDSVRHWAQVWSEAYSQSGDDLEDRRRNAIGWNSSYTQTPIPEAEMKEWLDATIEPILALAPKRVLEIGCGTGMLLFRLAPHCEHYTAADISAEALGWIERQRHDWPFGDRVTLLHAAADRIEGVAPGSVDLVIINSVIQYFPSVAYLVDVLERAAALLAPGGHLFVGDVRNGQWMEAFHASIQLFQAPDDLPVKALQQRVRASLGRERELLVDPSFFTALRQHQPRFTAVDVQLRRSVTHNEMSCFRVDVTLQVGGVAPQRPAQPIPRLDWAGDGLTLAQLGPRLATLQADVIEIDRIPNARLATEQQVLERLGAFDGPVAALKQQVDGLGDEWVDPALLRSQAQAAAWHCTLHPTDPFHYTAVFQRLAPGAGTPAPIPPYAVATAAPVTLRPWRSYANTPAFDILDRAALVGEWREHLQQRLPAYMVPASFTVLDRLPLTPNGKIDRKALPAPDSQRRDAAHVAPRDTVELQLVQIWERLLKVHPVGVRDPFFELGGHSLLAVRMVAQIEQVFGQRLSLTTLFHHTTIESLASVLRQGSATRSGGCCVPIQPQGSAPPLFLVHPAGGNVLCYLALAQQLGSDQPVYAFQAEGLESGQPPGGTIADMARTYIAAMQAVQPHGPYQLAGWSFGGLVAVEMAAQLQTQHETVRFLGLLDAIAPQLIRELTPAPDDDVQFFADYFAESNAALDLAHLRQLAPQAQLDYVVEQGRRLGVFPADVAIEHTRRLVQIYRHNMAAAARYHAPLLPIDFTLFAASERRPEDPALPTDHGWQACTTGSINVVAVPGQHHTMVNAPHVNVLAQRLKHTLVAGHAPSRRVVIDTVPT